MPFAELQHDLDPIDVLLDELGNIGGIEIFNNLVLVATYTGAKKTAGGIIMPDSITDENKIQSKVGLIVKLGPSAFVDDSGRWFAGSQVPALHEWVVYRAADGWSITVNPKTKVACRLLEDVQIRGRVSQPDLVW